MTPVDRDVAFSAPVGAPLRVRVRAVEVSGPAVRLTLALDEPSAARVLRDGLLNALPEVLPSGEQAAFDPDAPIVARVALRPSIARAFHQAGWSDGEVVTAFKSHPHNDLARALLATESWLLHDLTQEVPLPASLEGTGTLSRGVVTLWGDPEGALRRRAEGPAGGMARVVSRFVVHHGLTAETFDNGLTRLIIGDQSARYALVIQTDDDRGLCLVTSLFPELVPAARRDEVAQFLTRVNCGLAFGAFELDLDEGQVAVRAAVDVSADELTQGLLERLVAANLSLMGAHFEPLRALIRGDVDAAAALAQVGD